VVSALNELGSRDVQSLLLEGGPHLAGAFFEAGEVDWVTLFLAPLVLGGKQARAAVEGSGVEKIADAYRALTMQCDRIGDDMLITARMREW
jgi:diaminohydroxyphosphoribosylaminopyrimidine deaminase/5-amino-6-(5-phosphoribosylamino)uracil reductase